MEFSLLTPSRRRARQFAEASAGVMFTPQRTIKPTPADVMASLPVMKYRDLMANTTGSLQASADSGKPWL